MEPTLIAIGVVVVALAAFGLGRRVRHKDSDLLRLEEYDFYPFEVTESRHIEFDPDRFTEAANYFLEKRNARAARELIVIGEQNFVRDRFNSRDLATYKRLYDAYDGDSVITDNEAYLENYKRIVTLLGRSFPHTGIEILLHNLVNPTRSIVAIENGEVTGRRLEMGATNLVLDLKTRKMQNRDKLNYEINLGGRQFKCTTIPIFRPEYGLVGAVCINIDTRFLREDVKVHPDKLEAFLDNFLKTEFELEENILSPDEYQAALRGKRHFLDEAIRAGYESVHSTQLSAIMFSDIADYTTTMLQDEDRALRFLAFSTDIHRKLISEHGGLLLKEMGDGILASFTSVLKAVECARDLQNAVKEDGGFELRIGIHLGEVTQSGGDIFGDGVNIASRIQGAAAPGTIAVSEAVFANIRNKPGIEATDLGLVELKHIDEPLRLYQIST